MAIFFSLVTDVLNLYRSTYSLLMYKLPSDNKGNTGEIFTRAYSPFYWVACGKLSFKSLFLSPPVEKVQLRNPPPVQKVEIA